MKKKILALLSVFALTFVFAAPVTADLSVCSGFYGVRVWQDRNFSGPSWTLCGTSGLANIADSDLSNNTQNLNFGANWNDRISSIKTYNSNGSQRFRLYPDAGYKDNGSGPDRFVTITGTDQISDLSKFWPYEFNGGFNDVTSSLRNIP